MDEDVATMSLAARYTWAYLPCHADREGRLRDSSFFLRAQIFPGEAIDMEAVLKELAERRHIIRFQADGRRFIQIRSFARHQAPHARETPSEIPPPPAEGEPKASPDGAKVDAGQAKAVEGLHRVASRPSCSDLDPVLSPSVSFVVPLGPPDQTRDPGAPRTAYGLTNLFGVLWEKRYERMWQGQPTAARAASQFMDRSAGEIDQLAPMIRPAIERFLSDQRAFYLERGHAFELFVRDFDAHSGRAPPSRDVRVGHAMAEVKQRVSGEVKL